MSFKEVSLVVYDVLQFGWKELLAQGVCLIGIGICYIAGLLTTEQATGAAIAVLAASNLLGAYKVYKVSKQTVRPRG